MIEKSNIVSQKTQNAKYQEAVSLYATTLMTYKQIAESCGVSASAFRIYLYRHHRDLVLARYGAGEGVEDPSQIRLHAQGRQTPASHRKYREAIAACDDMAYIEYNVSQIARLFNLDGSALNNQLKLHYPEILERREKARARLGLNDHFLRGAHPDSVEEYAQAVELLRTTEMNLPQIADRCNVSLPALSQYLRFYHKDLLKQKTDKRSQAVCRRERGKMTGNNRLCEPSPEICEKYRESLELYRNTGLTVKEIVAHTGVPLGGFCNYLRKWHRNLMFERRGGQAGEGDNACTLDLNSRKRYLKSTAGKYAEAIADLEADPHPLSNVAAKYGFNPETFRCYLHKHHPQLVARVAELRTKKENNNNNLKTSEYD